MNPRFAPSIAVVLATACGTASATEYGTVISSTPVTRQVAVPRQDCADQPGYVAAPPSGGGALVGAVIGGLAGNAIGAGAGRALATGIGAVTGAVVGNDVEAGNTPLQPVTTTRCTYSRAVESRIVGYDVVYEYDGQQRRARLARDPGERIALAVAPAAETMTTPAPATDASPYDAPLPAAPYPVYPAAYPAYPAAYGAPVYDPYPYYGPYGYGVSYSPSLYIGGRFGWGGGGGWGRGGGRGFGR